MMDKHPIITLTLEADRMSGLATGDAPLLNVPAASPQTLKKLEQVKDV